MSELETVKTEQYDGSIESALKLIENLGIAEGNYYYDLKDKYIILHSRGWLFRAGDNYSYRLPEHFEAIG